MSKGKEALAARNAEIKQLKENNLAMYKEIVRLRQIEKEIKLELSQFETYKSRMSEVAALIQKSAELEINLEQCTKELELWRYRTITLARADRDLEESQVSKESLAVLADLDMLPLALRTTRYARRHTKSGAAIIKQWDMVDNVLNEVESKGIVHQLRGV
jgi:hypothetical protein